VRCVALDLEELREPSRRIAIVAGDALFCLAERDLRLLREPSRSDCERRGDTNAQCVVDALEEARRRSRCDYRVVVRGEGVEHGLEVGEEALAVQPFPEPRLSFLELRQAFFWDMIALDRFVDQFAFKAITETLRNRLSKLRT